MFDLNNLINILTAIHNNEKIELQDTKNNWMILHNPVDYKLEWFINNLNYLRIKKDY